ncbi:protein CASP [Cyclospora cayetanensis]|uniref:Protein CASP n=1 Tax=Cyclospora cayetanensis TaxID=88456 RepID=A0A6P6RSN4_9EIME|nr:protein CASP [Cyclospora cayetanensis]
MDIIGGGSTTTEAVASWISCWQDVRSFAPFCDEIEKSKRAAVESRKRLASETKVHRRLWSSLIAASSESTHGEGRPPSPDNAEEDQESACPLRMQPPHSPNGPSETPAAGEHLKSATEQLLKGYQQEVDSLTKRAKAAESAFLSLLQRLLQQPDLMVILRDLEATSKLAASAPSASECESLKRQLQLQADAARELAEKNAKLEKEYFELECEIQRAKDQTITVRLLERQVQQQQQQLQQQEQQLQQQQQQLQLALAENALQLEVAEQTHQLEDAHQQIARLERRLQQQQQQFVSTQEALERQAHALAAELQLLTEAQQREVPREGGKGNSVAAHTTNALKALQSAQGRIKELMETEKRLEADVQREQQMRSRLEEAHAKALAAASKKAEDLGMRLVKLEVELAQRARGVLPAPRCARSLFSLYCGVCVYAARALSAPERQLGVLYFLASAPAPLGFFFDPSPSCACALVGRRAAARTAEVQDLHRERLSGSSGRLPVGSSASSGLAADPRDALLSSLRDENARLREELKAAQEAAEKASEARSARLDGVQALEPSLHALHPAAAEAAASGGAPPTAGSVGTGVLQLVVAQREAYKSKLAETEQERDSWRAAALSEQQSRAALAVENYSLSCALREGGASHPINAPEANLVALRGAPGPSGGPPPAVEILGAYSDGEGAESLSEETDGAAAPLPFVTSLGQRRRQHRSRRGPPSFVKGVMAVADCVATAAADTARSILGSRGGPCADTRASRTPDSTADGRNTPARGSGRLQQQQNWQHLSVGERVVVIWGRMLLSSRATRTFALIYFTLLHTLVFLVLFFAADSASSAGGGGPPNVHAYLNE